MSSGAPLLSDTGAATVDSVELKQRDNSNNGGRGGGEAGGAGGTEGDGYMSSSSPGIQRCWSGLVDRMRKSTLFRMNLIQFVVSVCFLVATLLGACHIGTASVCFIDPWLTDFLPLAFIQLALNGAYLFWPRAAEKVGRGRLPIIINACLCVGWHYNFYCASRLMAEGIRYGTSYHFVHIPRFILSIAEIICSLAFVILFSRRQGRA